MGLGQDQQQEPAVHTVGVDRGRVRGVAVGVSVMCHVTGDTKHMTNNT